MPETVEIETPDGEFVTVSLVDEWIELYIDSNGIASATLSFANALTLARTLAHYMETLLDA